MRRRLSAAAAALAAILFCLPVTHARADDPAGVATFDTWTAICNNLAQCVAVGAEDGELLTLLVARDARPEDEPSVKLNLVRTDDDKTPVSSVGLTVVDGDKKTTLDVPQPSVSQGDDRIVTVTLPVGASSHAFVDATRNGASLTFRIGASGGSFPLKGMSAALRWIDERQGRAGTASALVAKGTAPPMVPGERPVPEVTAAPAGSATEVAKPLMSAALKAAMPKGDDCEAELLTSPDAADSLFAWKLAADRLLVFVPCSRGAYNFSAALFFTDANGGSPRPVPLRFPAGPRDNMPTNILTNAEFDPAKMELSEFAKGRGLGDCGSLTTWVWTGQDFTLLNASAQSTCAGLSSDDWPNVYKAAKK